MEQQIRELCEEKGWVEAEFALKVAAEVGYEKVLDILGKQPYKSDMKREPAFVDYQFYLMTPHWRRVRTAALARAGFHCMLCNKGGELHVHHRTYERLWREEPEDVIVLCAECHAKFHDKEVISDPIVVLSRQ